MYKKFINSDRNETEKLANTYTQQSCDACDERGGGEAQCWKAIHLMQHNVCDVSI